MNMIRQGIPCRSYLLRCCSKRSSSSSVSADSAPLALSGWCFDEPRDTVNGIACGSALLDGDYRTSWPHFEVPQQYALAGTLAYLKGGIDSLPRGVTLPPSADGRVACTLIHDIVAASRQALQERKDNNQPFYPEHLIFDRTYDLIVPLPSSSGPGASQTNHTAASTLASALSPVPGGDAGPQVAEAVLRVQKMETKSTETKRDKRKNRDAPRRMHFSNMLVDKTMLSGIQGTKILLWDDVITWGNTSEAARNLLFMAGASRVDLLTAFSTGPVTRAHVYNSNHSLDSDETVIAGAVGDMPDANNYTQQSSVVVSKELIEWDEGEDGQLLQWHDNLGIWVRKHFPHYVPNDIPF